jgi:hypothetical protein
LGIHMRKAVVVSIGVCVIVTVLGFVAHAKLAVIVFQPTPTFPEGATLLVDRDPYLPFMDSGLAWCSRTHVQERGEPHCPEKLLWAYMESDRVLLKLPYSDALQRLSLD